ncbi:MAG: hypothetical protein GVY36_19725 [Verrucomicrobia bacterium]|jgi:hypothetical protein|nr:hypothetical protein [Verrucomicrobiota bacterium]
MKIIYLAVFTLLVATFSLSAEIEIVGQPKQVGSEIEPVIKEILRDKDNLNNLIYLIQLLERGYEPMNGDDNQNEIHIVHYVPAVPALVDNYGQEALPYLLNYALKTKNVYLKRRAVYVIEKISKMSMRDYLGRLIGKEAIQGKFEELANCLNVEVEYEYLKYFPDPRESLPFEYFLP